MPMINLDLIVAGANARTIASEPEADEGLRRSIAAVGVLQPILLRPLRVAGDDAPIPINARSNRLEIVLGSRRCAAARAAGLIEIPAEIRDMSDADVRAAQMAENMQRARLHPVDQWRGVKSLLFDDAMTIAQASAALGFDERMTRRMELLGRLHPALLALCEIEMPGDRVLRRLANASAKRQREIVESDHVLKRAASDPPNWYGISRLAEVDRLPRATAIFDTAIPGIAWDEDLFAEPESDDQFTTADIGEFLSRQEAALKEQIAAKTKGRHLLVKALHGYEIKVPSGSRVVHTADITKLKKNQTALYAIGSSGKILTAVAEPVPARTAKAAAAEDREAREDEAGTDEDDAWSDDDENAAPAPEPETKAPFSKPGLAAIREAKTEALREALRKTPTDAGTALALLVLALSARNVTIWGASRRSFLALAGRIILPGGGLSDLTDEEISAIGREAAALILVVGDRNETSASQSGAAAEWIGAAIDAQRFLPRFDNAAFLATAKTEELKRAAADAGLRSKGSAAELRRELLDHAPHYRPELTMFGAPAPAGGRDV